MGKGVLKYNLQGQAALIAALPPPALPRTATNHLPVFWSLDSALGWPDSHGVGPGAGPEPRPHRRAQDQPWRTRQRTSTCALSHQEAHVVSWCCYFTAADPPLSYCSFRWALCPGALREPGVRQRFGRGFMFVLLCSIFFFQFFGHVIIFCEFMPWHWVLNVQCSPLPCTLNAVR